MSKYLRHQSIISRHIDDNIDSDHWLKQFEKKLEKNAVQPKNVDQSLFDQINSIMNNTQSKYPSVAAAVEDMKERSGLTAYLQKIQDINKVSVEEGQNKKIALDASTNNKLPDVIQKCPAIKRTLENYINDTGGNLPIPAIIEKIKSIHRNDVSSSKDWDDEKLIYFVSNLNLKAKKNNPATYENYHNLGSQDRDTNAEIDPSNTDAFHSLNPVIF